MLLDRAGTVGGKKTREIFDAFEKRLADVGVRNALARMWRIDDLLGGVMVRGRRRTASSRDLPL